MFPCHEQPRQPDYKTSITLNIVRLQNRPSNVSWFSWDPDTRESTHDYSRYCALQLVHHTGANGQMDDRTEYYGLVVKPVDGCPTTWTRMGYYSATWDATDFEDSEGALFYLGES